MFLFYIDGFLKNCLLFAKPIGVILLGVASFYKLPSWLDKSYNLEAIVQSEHPIRPIKMLWLADMLTPRVEGGLIRLLGSGEGSSALLSQTPKYLRIWDGLKEHKRS